MYSYLLLFENERRADDDITTQEITSLWATVKWLNLHSAKMLRLKLQCIIFYTVNIHCVYNIFTCGVELRFK